MTVKFMMIVGQKASLQNLEGAAFQKDILHCSIDKISIEVLDIC